VPAAQRLVVLDTNVISELMRPGPDTRVVNWAHQLSPAAACTTSVTLAEVRFGILRLPPGRRRDLLRDAADDVFSTFEDRVLSFDADAAGHYADVVAERERVGAPISGFDAQIAAICRTHHAAVATRNCADFDRLGLEVVDPWVVDI
jgi:predicted nucleic acid-binding protein